MEFQFECLSSISCWRLTKHIYVSTLTSTVRWVHSVNFTLRMIIFLIHHSIQILSAIYSCLGALILEFQLSHHSEHTMLFKHRNHKIHGCILFKHTQSNLFMFWKWSPFEFQLIISCILTTESSTERMECQLTFSFECMHCLTEVSLHHATVKHPITNQTVSSPIQLFMHIFQRFQA